MTPRSSSTTPQLPREDIELLARVEGVMQAVLEQGKTTQEILQRQWEATQEMAQKQRDDHNEQIELLNKRLITVETFQATHLSEKSIRRWNDSASWSERYQDRMALLMTIGGVVVTILSGVIVWLMNAFIIPILQGGK